MGATPPPIEFCEESVTVMKTVNQPESSNESESKITADQALWLTRLRPSCIPFIIKQGEKKISQQAAEGIFSHEVQILSERGFDDLFGKKIRADIERGLIPSDERILALLKYHLKRRIADFFRNTKAVKRGYVIGKCGCGKATCTCEDRVDGWHRICDVSEHVVAAVPDDTAVRALEGIEAKSDLEYLYTKAWPSLNETDKIILIAAWRNPAGGFNRSSLYESMSEVERRHFLPKGGAQAIDEEEKIKCAIASRTAELCRTLRRAVAEDLKTFALYGA